MPFNLMKKYDSLLDLESFNPSQREESLSKIFQRDFIEYQNTFNNKKVIPTIEDGKTKMEILFSHLTRYDDHQGETNERIFDLDRAKRIHWIRHHLEHYKKETDLSIFSVKESNSIRTYILNETKSYVIILEHKQTTSSQYYFLLTAYYLKGRNLQKIINKKKRQLNKVD